MSKRGSFTNGFAPSPGGVSGWWVSEGARARACARRQELLWQAEYQSKKEGRLLVVDVDFTLGGSRIKVIQHITYHQDSETLRARYMDTLGDEAAYTWVLDHREIRVSLGGEDSDTYFRASLSDDNSEYVGTWHYPAGGPPDSAESIVYTRVQDDG